MLISLLTSHHFVNNQGREALFMYILKEKKTAFTVSPMNDSFSITQGGPDIQGSNTNFVTFASLRLSLNSESLTSHS